MKEMIEVLRRAGVEDPSLDARLLLCAAAEIDHLDLVRDPEAQLDECAAERIESLVERRVAREPVSRILGLRGFWSLDLEITPDVLDPRPDTETLVDAALDLFSDRQNDPLRVADLGCGSGALTCALLEVFPNARAVAIDISPAACEVTRRNTRRLGLDSRCEVRTGDWRSAEPGPYDLVVSNPPYIPTSAISALTPEVRAFDPVLALDGGPDGLDCYRSIAVLLPCILAPGGKSVLEIGHDQAVAVTKILTEAGFAVMPPRVDAGGNPRALVASMPKNPRIPTETGNS